MKNEVKMILKKSTSVVLALVMVLSGVLVHVGTIALAAPEYQQADEVLFESDYNSATAKALESNGQPWLWGPHLEMTGDMCVMKDPADSNNNVVHYSHFQKAYGRLMLGDDYVDDEINNSISVKKGVTYKIEYKWKAVGTVADWGNLTVGLGLSDGTSLSEVSGGDGLLSTLAQPTNEIVLEAGKACDTDWQPVTKYYTVDESTDITSKNKLVMYGINGGSDAHVYIDDIKVTALAGVTVNYVIDDDTKTVFYGDGNIPETLPEGIAATDNAGGFLNWYKDDKYETPFSIKNYVRTGTYKEITIYGRYEKLYEKDTVLFENDYNNATAKALESNGQPWLWGSHLEMTGDMCVMKDPSDNNNNAVHYSHFQKAFGRLMLGDDYVDDEINNSIAVKKGVIYKIDFRWKSTGIVADWGNLTVGLALSDGAAYDYGTITGVDKFLETLSQPTSEIVLEAGKSCDTEWESKTIYYTVDEDTDISSKNKLVMYGINGGSNAHVYIDDVKVTALAGVTVDYKIGDKTTSVYYADGNIPTTLPEGISETNADGAVLVLYTDKEYENEFVAANYQRTGEYKTVTLYGKYKDFKYDKDKVLFENDYNSAAEKAVESNGQPNLGENPLLAKGGDLCVVADPADSNNKAVHYSHHRKGFGMLVLGDDYSDDTVDQYIQVKKGVTYQVDFKWKATGKVADWGNLTVGLGLHNGASNASVVSGEAFVATLAQKQDAIILSANTEYNTDWQTKTAYFNVDTATDLTKGNRLVLYGILGGSDAHVYIDDVKVTALAGVTVDYVVDKNTVSVYYSDGKIPETIPAGLEETDAAGNVLTFYKDKEYKNAFDAKEYVRTGVYETVTLYGRYEEFSYKKDTVLTDDKYDDAVIPADQPLHLNSADLMPAKDPTDATDMVLRYNQKFVGLGVLQLGYDYTDLVGKENLTEYVKAHAGITYKIEFDYLAKGTVKDTPCEMGLAIGASSYTYGWPDGVSQTNYPGDYVTWSKQLMSFGVGETVNTGWKSETVYLTVPEDCDLSKYDALQVYAKGGSANMSIYFDNVKVTGLKDRSYTVKFVTNGGNAIADMKVNLAGLNNLPQATRSNAVFMGWYLDSTFKTPFNVDKCIEATKPITVYAKWHMFTNGAPITMDDLSYWNDESGTLNAGRLNFAFVPAKEGSNNVMKFAMGSAGSGPKVEKRGNVLLDNDTYAQRMILYNPDLTVTGDYDYMDVTYRAQVGKTYKVSFKYKVTGVDSAKSDKGIAFSVLTGNVLNSHSEWVTQSNRFVVENSTTGWKTATAYFTVKELGKAVVHEGKSYYSDAIMLGVSGFGSALIDDVRVTDWDIEAPTYVEFSTKGGEPIISQEYIMNANTVLPKAVRKGYVFDAWYLDVKCTKKFNPASYKRTNGILVLYAGYQGMQGVTEIDFEDYSYYLLPTGEFTAQRISESLTPLKEKDNTVAKYSLKYATKNIEKFGQAQGNFATYGATIGLHDPAVFADTNWTFEDAALRVKEGQKYWISYQYKVNSVDTESTHPSAVTFGVGVTKEDSVHTGRQIFKQEINPVDAKTDGWVTASTYFTVPKLTEGTDRLSLFIFGYGELLLDNIKIIQLNDAVIFDTDGGTVIEPLRGSAGQQVKLPKDPVREDSKFMNWSTDANGTQEYTGGKMEKGVKVVYAKFLTYQTIQDFEHYNIGKSERFETDYYLNKKTNDTDQTKYHNWLGTKFDAEQVRNGKVSVLRQGEESYARFMGLFYMNNPLTVGEEYELSVWVKVTEYFLPGDIQIVYSDLLENMRAEDYWDANLREARFETIANTELMSEYEDEWLEIKYTFTAKSKYIGLATPGITGMYIDDACITLTSADESYARSIEGPGLKYEDWYSEAPKKEVVEVEEDYIKLDMNGNMDKFPKWVVIASVASVVVLVAGLVTTGILVKKKRRGEIKS